MKNRRCNRCSQNSFEEIIHITLKTIGMNETTEENEGYMKSNALLEMRNANEYFMIRVTIVA